MKLNVSLTVWTLLGLTCAAIGAIGALLFLLPVVPPSLTPSSASETVPVHEATFNDERAAEFSIVTKPNLELEVPRGGTITSWACEVDGSFGQEESDVSVDEFPLLTVATSSPLWRDIEVGDKGQDVRGLQKFMKEHGADLEVDGVADQRLVSALAKRASEAGQPRWESGIVPLSSLFWVPKDASRIAECLGRLGQTIQKGESVAVMDGGVKKITQVDSEAPSLVPGKRMAIVSGETFSLDEDGAISDRTDLEALVSTPEYLGAVADGAGSLHGTTALADPIKVSVVPPSAVFDVRGQKGCIVGSDGVEVPIRIVGSNLGQSYVIPPAEATVPSDVIVRPEKEKSCP